jgi:Cys-tRNA(Pro)/Cys-tRNA(Cys) deacylase
MNKTNAMRLLEQAGIEFETKEYEVDENDLSGVSVAKKVGLDPDSVFKTLVAKGDKKGIAVFCIPVTEELDLKKAAKVFGDKKIEMLHVKDLLPVTGYIRGGCSPVGMKKQYPTFMDETAILFDKIAVSAGVRGAQIIISPERLAEYVGASLTDLCI